MTEQELDQLLNAIAQRLSLQKTKEPNDGLITVTGYKSVYLSRDKEDAGIMYHVTNGEISFSHHNAIKGKLVRVASYIKNEGDKKLEAEKLSFFFDCSQSKYRLEVGIDRIAGKDILSDIVTMSSKQLESPITVAFKRGNEDVIFAKVLESDRDRTGVKYEEIDSKELLEQVQILIAASE